MSVAARDTREDHSNAEEVFGKRLEECRLVGVDDKIMSKLCQDIFLSQIEIGEVFHLRCRHVDRIPGIEGPDERETDEDAAGKLQPVCKDGLEFEQESAAGISAWFW